MQRSSVGSEDREALSTLDRSRFAHGNPSVRFEGSRALFVSRPLVVSTLALEWFFAPVETTSDRSRFAHGGPSKALVVSRVLMVMKFGGGLGATVLPKVRSALIGREHVEYDCRRCLEKGLPAAL